MTKWIAKALIQKGISYLPMREKINFLFQKYVTKGVHLSDEHFENKLTHARDHIAYLAKYGKASNNKILELGTGWYPIIPIFMYLMDVGEVVSIDIQNWMNKERQLITLQKIKTWRNSGKLARFFEHINESKWQSLEKILNNSGKYDQSAINRTIGLNTLLCDAQNLPFSSNSFDFICSNNTFEHVDKEVLKGILREFKRVLKKDGLMSHFIDLSDHFAHFDHSISIYNFLKFSQKQWSLIDNSIQPQNRMRFEDYRNMYHELQIPISEENIRKGDLAALSTVNVHPEFAHHPPEALAISHGYMVSVFA